LLSSSVGTGLSFFLSFLSRVEVEGASVGAMACGGAGGRRSTAGGYAWVVLVLGF
jgi:hypothetical protein